MSPSAPRLFNYQLFLIALLGFLLLAIKSSSIAATVTLTMQDASFPTQVNDGGDFFNSGSTELGMWANTGNKNTAAWGNFTTSGFGGTARNLQIGDVFTITVNATRATGQIGFSLNNGGTQGTSYANNLSGSRMYISTDNYAAWSVKGLTGGATSTLSYVPLNTHKDYRFTVRITSQTTADVYLTVDSTDYQAYNLALGGTAGANISALSIFGSNLNNGSSNENAYWKQTSTIQDTGLVELGYYLSSGTFTPGIVTDGLAADSTSTVRVNDVFIGGDAGSQVNLTQANTYTGNTTVNTNATAEAQNANAFGGTDAGTRVSSGGALKLYHATGISFAAESLTLNGTGVGGGNGSLRNVGGNNTWTGTVTLAGNTRINADTTGGNGSLTISGGIDGGANALFLGTQGGTGGRTGGDITLSGPVGGAGAVLASHANTTTSLFKDGLGALTLSGSSNFTGATLLNQGTILVGNNNAFGNGVVQVHWDNTTDTKTIASTNETARTFANNLNIYNNVTLGAVDRIGNLNFIGAVDLGSEAGNRTITTAAGTSHAFSGNVAGLRQIIKEGTGSLALGGNNTFSGGVQLNNGTILIGSNTALGSGTLQVQFDIAGTKTIASADATARSITNNVNVFNDLTIGQASGGTGSLSLGGNIFLGNEVGQNRIFTIVGTHAITGNITGNRGIVKQGTGTLTASGVNTSTGGVYIHDGAFNLDGGSIAFSGIDIGSGEAGSQSPNNATLRVSSNSSYNQNIVVNAEGASGTRSIDFANTSGNATLSGSVALEKSAEVSVASGGTGLLTGQVSGAGGITKSSAGLLRLGGNNTYNGTTSIEGGALEVSSANALGSTAGNTAVSSGAALQLAGDTTIATEALSLNGSGQSNGGALRSVSGNNSYNGAITLAASSRINSDAGTLNLGGGITGASQNLTIGGAGNTVVGSVIGTTTGSLAKDGAGTLTLNAQNTYNGTTTVNAGTLALGHATNTLADSSSVVVAGGELSLGSNIDTVASFAIGNGTLAGTGTLTATTYALQGGTVAANLGTGTANVATGTTTLNGALAANTVNINSGNLTLGSADRLSDSAAVSVAGGTLNLGANNDTVGSLTLNGTLAGTGTLTAATYALQGGTVNANLGTGTANVATGTTMLNGALAANTVNINSGNLTLGAADRLSDSATVSVAAGALNLGANNDTVGSLTLNGTLAGSGTLTAATYALQGGTVAANLGTGTANVATGTTALNGALAANTVNINSGNLTLGSADRLSDSAAVSVAGGTLNLVANNDTVGSLTLNGTLAGTGTLTAATYALQGGTVNAGLGNGSVAVSTGTTTLGSAGRLNSGSSLAINSGQLNLGGAESIAALSGSGGTLNLGNNILTTSVSAGTSTFSGTITGTGGGLTKAGAGELILAGTSTYTGTTTVSAGTLRVNGSLASETVSVGNTATLGGNATISGAVTLNNGGTLAPGNSVGTMNLNGGLTLNSGGNVTMEITGASTFDKIIVTGGSGISYGGVLYISLGGFTPAYNSNYDLFDGARVASTNFSSILFSDSFDGTGSTFDYDTGTLTVVPEPSTWALIGVGAAFVLWRLRRRKA